MESRKSIIMETLMESLECNQEEAELLAERIIENTEMDS